jgi:hypothetical protein
MKFFTFSETYFRSKPKNHPDTNTSTETVSNSEDLLPKEPCLQALAALRHSKWFQVCFCFFFGRITEKDLH